MKNPSSKIDFSLLIRPVPNFPKAGILFRDITPLLADGNAFRAVIDDLCAEAVALNPEVIAGIEARGFIFGAPIAAALKLPFVPIRKPGKLPAACKSVQYALEYGHTQLDIHGDALRPGHRVVIVDDLLATGGTARAAAQLVEMLGGVVVGIITVVELSILRGRNLLPQYAVKSLVRYDE